MQVNFLLAGMFTSWRISVGYVYMLELCPLSGQVFIGTFWNGVEGTIFLLLTLWYWLSTSKSWFWPTLVGYLIQVWVCFGIWLMPESPRWLLEK